MYRVFFCVPHCLSCVCLARGWREHGSKISIQFSFFYNIIFIFDVYLNHHRLPAICVVASKFVVVVGDTDPECGIPEYGNNIITTVAG